MYNWSPCIWTDETKKSTLKLQFAFMVNFLRKHFKIAISSHYNYILLLYREVNSLTFQKVAVEYPIFSWNFLIY